ncbi:MAG: SEC-C domain-containing protein [Planctomycetaceae bacterium]
MAYDPYALCPCGSGKKLKFCCQAIADDMERITRLIDNNQLRGALQQLEALDKRQPLNEWVTTTRALILIEIGESVAARDLLRGWLETHPEGDFAEVLFAVAQLQADGYDAAKKAVQRAYHRGAKKYPTMISGLAGAVAAVMQQRDQPLAVRECLALALRFAADQNRQELFVRLLEFDADQELEYPLRSMHPLPAISAGSEHDKDVKRALKLASIGCWDHAADLLTGLAEKSSSAGALWQAAGLCRAFDGDSVRAAQVLHRAAAECAEFAVAVECEVLAQLLDRQQAPEQRSFLAVSADVQAVSRLLSTLDAQPRLVRVPVPPQRDADHPTPSALYQVLDRPALTERDALTLTLDAIPQVWAQIVVYDAEGDQQPRLVLTGLSGPPFDGAMELLKSLAGDQIQWSSEPPESLWQIPREQDILTWQWSFPPKMSISRRRELDREQWRRITQEIWPNHAQAALGGNTPLGAAPDSARRVALTAAVLVFDADCACRRHSLDTEALFRRLGLEPLAALTLSPETSPNSLSILQLHRLDVGSLTDEQLVSVVNRALLIHHHRFLKQVLEEALRRPGCAAEIDLSRAHQALIELTAAEEDIGAAIHWVQEARRHELADQPRFEDQWRWDLRELSIRLAEPTATATTDLIQKFVSYYGPKVPQLRPYLEIILEEAGVESPWASGLITPETGAPGALWTPDAESQTPVGGGKLWLPGQ